MELRNACSFGSVVLFNSCSSVGCGYKLVSLCNRPGCEFFCCLNRVFLVIYFYYGTVNTSERLVVWLDIFWINQDNCDEL